MTGFILDEARGEIVCRHCGRVAISKIQNESEEKITYAESDVNHARTSAVDNYTENMGTTIAGDDPMSRLTKAQDPKTKALLEAKKSITHYGGVLNMTDITLSAAQQIFKDYLGTSNHKPKGANADHTILGILYLAARGTEAPAEIKHLSSATGIPTKSIRAAINKLMKAVPKYNQNGSSAADLIVRYGKQLQLPQNLISISEDVAKGASSYLEGKYPATVAAASILLVADCAQHPIKAEAVAKAASITSSTVLAAFKDIQPHREKLLPSDWKRLIS